MKRLIARILVICSILLLVGCSKQETYVNETLEGNIKTYCEMSNGTWECNEQSYQYRLEISGRMPNAQKDSTFVYLSNLEEISFKQAWEATGVSSFLGDYFPVEDAVLVEWR